MCHIMLQLWIFTGNWYYYYSHLTDDETEEQKSNLISEGDIGTNYLEIQNLF